MATIPELWLDVKFEEGVINKLSRIPPYNKCQVDYMCINTDFDELYANITFENQPTGKTQGERIYTFPFTQGIKNTKYTFSVIATDSSDNWSKKGQGTYTVNIYVRAGEIWNIYQFFLTTETDGSHKQLQTTSLEDFMVQE